jgi:hypothetical protein
MAALLAAVQRHRQRLSELRPRVRATICCISLQILKIDFGRKEASGDHTNFLSNLESECSLAI